MEHTLIIAAALAALAALLYAWRSSHSARRTMELLEQMLNEAIQGSFIQEHYDESRLAKTETRLAQYLAASQISAQNVAADKARLEELIADISHQTKTPLANILLYTQLLAEQELPEEARKCAAALEAQAGKLQSLIEALVKTSRLETGVLALHPVPCPLLPTLEAAVSQLAQSAAAKGVSLQLYPAEIRPMFDPKWTAEALCNLLDNAVKYTPAGGSVSVRACSYEMFCRIDVADSGPGVPEAEQAKIFQRFYRSHAAHEVEGIGLGLYLARQIAEGQGGYIKVANNPASSGGAVFSLYLPLA